MDIISTTQEISENYFWNNNYKEYTGSIIGDTDFVIDYNLPSVSIEEWFDNISFDKEKKSGFGLFKGVKVNEKDIEKAKKSLFPDRF